MRGSPVIIATAVAVLALSSCSAPASYKADIQSIVTVDSTEVSVTARITNTSGTTDTPTCSVNIGSQAGSDLGSQTGQLSKPIKAGATTTAVLQVDVKDAQNLSKDNSSISCS